jgi:hypothetical protein
MPATIMDFESLGPDWWNWDLEITPHLLKRMIDRQFSELDLRVMLADAREIKPEPEGRYRIVTRRDSRIWNVIVEPDFTDQVVLVITAYPRD